MNTLANRRDLLAALAAVGVGTDPFRRSLAATAQEPKAAAGVTVEMVKQAEWVAGITLSDEERKAVAQALTGTKRSIEAGRTISIPNAVPPAFQFNPTPHQKEPQNEGASVQAPKTELKRPDQDEDIAFAPAYQLAHLLATKQISSVELTKLFLDRLQKYDAALKCVVTFTDDLAMKQAKRADEERAKGEIRGVLHGIPWGAKDLIAVPGYKTTWGAGHFKEQSFDEPATVYSRLENAGMVLVAKLTLGALAVGR